MTRPVDLVHDGAAALRALTDGASDGRATRARIVRALEARATTHHVLKWGAATLGVVVFVASSAAVAWTMLHDGPAPTRSPPAPSVRAAPRPITPPPAANADANALELTAYGAAHEAHFRGTSPRRALLLWDEYLRAFPRGTFALEARFNRGICLVRLGRARAAAAALEPFARRRFGSYRAKEACEMLDQLTRASPADVAPVPACVTIVRTGPGGAR